MALNVAVPVLNNAANDRSTSQASGPRSTNLVLKRFLGYSKPTGYGSGVSDDPVGECKAGDEVCKLTDKDQWDRGTHVEKERKTMSKSEVKALVKDVGCHGVSPIVEALPYVHCNNAFPIPIAHAVPYGIVPDFWDMVLRSPEGPLQLSKENKKIVMARASHLVNTIDFGRGYLDIVSRRKSMVMEQWVHFIESWNVYVLKHHNGRPLLPKKTQEMWDCLRKGLLYFLRLFPTDDAPKQCSEAVASLKRYAEIAEEEKQYSLCMYNLHVLICRLSDQEAERGKVAFGSEYWIENKIQYCKQAILNRTTRFPAMTLVKHLWLGEALSNLSAGGKVFSVREAMGPASRPMRGVTLMMVMIEGASCWAAVQACPWKKRERCMQHCALSGGTSDESWGAWAGIRTSCCRGSCSNTVMRTLVESAMS